MDDARGAPAVRRAQGAGRAAACVGGRVFDPDAAFAVAGVGAWGSGCEL